MDDRQINLYLKKMGALSKCQGIFCIDEYKTDLKTGHFAILNTLPKKHFETSGKQISGHWCLILAGRDLNDAKSLIYFDPIGSLPQNVNFVLSLLHCKKQIFYNNFNLQSLFSSLCAHHCLFTVYHWLHGLAIDEILLSKYDVLSPYEFQNDVIVKRFVSLI